MFETQGGNAYEKDKENYGGTTYSGNGDRESLPAVAEETVQQVPMTKEEIAELINAVQPESGEYDPAGAAAYEYFSVQTNCYEGFVNYDKEGKIVPAAADHWDVNDDATEYTFYIRDDEKWSDGSDVTSADFENTMKRALEPDNGSWYVDFLFVIKNAEKCFNGKCDFKDVGIECIDDKTIKFTLEEPCSYFLDLCKLPTYMPSNCKYATDDNKDWDMNPGTELR